MNRAPVPRGSCYSRSWPGHGFVDCRGTSTPGSDRLPSRHARRTVRFCSFNPKISMPTSTTFGEPRTLATALFRSTASCLTTSTSCSRGLTQPPTRSRPWSSSSSYPGFGFVGKGFRVASGLLGPRDSWARGLARSRHLHRSQSSSGWARREPVRISSHGLDWLRFIRRDPRVVASARCNRRQNDLTSARCIRRLRFTALRRHDASDDLPPLYALCRYVTVSFPPSVENVPQPRASMNAHLKFFPPTFGANVIVCFGPWHWNPVAAINAPYEAIARP